MPRPTSASATGRRNASAPRALVGGFRTDLGFELNLDVRTAYDFVLSLRAAGVPGDELLPDDRRWLEDARASAADVLAADPVLFGDAHLCTELSQLFAQRPEVKTAADVVALVESRSDAELVEGLLSELTRDQTLGPLLTRILGGDQSPLGEFEAKWAEIEPDHPIGDMLRHREATAEHIRAALKAWLGPYQEIEARVGRMLVRDSDARRADLRTLPPAEVIERATGGLRSLPEARIRRIVLAPSYFGRPYNFLVSGDGWRLIVYPIGDEALDEVDPLAPPPAAIRLYRALGDETRLRILRLLVDSDLYLTELAQKLELSKPTVKHHLTQLRTAGLVTIVEEGGLTYYNLRRNRIAEAGPELGRFLGI